MKRSIAIMLGEAKSRMSGYVALTNYRYMNLCVNAEPASLLCVNVELDDTTYNMEEVAAVAKPKDDQFAILPKDSSKELFLAIGKGIMASHPEFKQEVKDLDEEDESGDGEGNGISNIMNSDDMSNKYILLTMPEINGDRHDIIIDGVDSLQKECIAKLDAVMQEYTQKFAIKLKGADVKEVDEAKDNLQGLYDQHKELLEEYSNNKKEEVEKAYQRYQEEQDASENERQEEAAARNEEASQSMRMGFDDDDEY